MRGPVVHQPVYIVQLACLEHAESIRRRCAFPLPCRRIHMCPVLFLKPAQRGISKTCLNLVRYLSRFWTKDSFQQLCALGVATGMIKGSFPMFMRNSATQNIYVSCFPWTQAWSSVVWQEHFPLAVSISWADAQPLQTFQTKMPQVGMAPQNLQLKAVMVPFFFSDIYDHSQCTQMMLDVHPRCKQMQPDIARMAQDTG